MVRALLTLVALALAAPAAAQLYRWVDERGVVNYGDTPPANARQVMSLSPEKSGVSVVPGLSRDELDRAKTSLEQARIERLEREVSELREERRAAPPPAPATTEAAVYYPAYFGYPTHRPRPPDHKPPGTKPHPKLLPEPPAPPLYSPKGK